MKRILSIAVAVIIALFFLSTCGFSYDLGSISIQLPVNGKIEKSKKTPSKKKGPSLSIPVSEKINKEKMVNDYLSVIYRKIQANRHYPDDVRIGESSVDVKIGVIVNKNGNISDRFIIKGCNYKSIDAAAIKTIVDSSPFPPFPIGLEQSTLQFTIDIIYNNI